METMRNPVNWFEIPALDLARARRFYEAVFGYALTPAEMGPLAMAWFPMPTQESPGATGSLVKGEGYAPTTAGTLVYFTVGDLEGVLQRVNANGGKTLIPKTAIGEYGFIAHFEDCEGNREGLHCME